MSVDKYYRFRSMTALPESFDMIIFVPIIVWGNLHEHSLAKSPLTSHSISY